MEDFENKLGQILANPEMMGKVMAMAQSFQNQAPPAEPQAPEEPIMPDIDLAAVQKLTGLLGKAGVDAHQKALLAALGPYLSHQRIRKLEKAMRTAKLAGAATSFLGNAPLFSGR